MRAFHLEFHVEEFSMEAFLHALLPRMLPADCSFDIHPYPGKAALLRRLGSRLRGYARWMPAEYRIVVIVDCDSDACKVLKSTLEDICRRAGLRSRRVAGRNWQIVTRIAIEELEAWYFGNWPAVHAAYPGVSPNIPRQARYRDPDAIRGGTWEAFERVMQKHGHFKQGLAKAEAAAAIGKQFDPTTNGSRSFAVFRDAVAEAVT